MNVLIDHYIENEQYVTRIQLEHHYPITVYDAQRFLEENRSHIKHITSNRVIYYKKSDVDRAFITYQKLKLKKLRKEVIEQTKEAKELI